MALTKIDITNENFNPFETIGDKWMLVSAGTEEKWNTMTVSWGAFGVIWGKPSATCYIRRSRYTRDFVDASEYYTLTVLKDGHRDALKMLGSKSGRDIDKMHKSGLTPIFVEGLPTFEETALTVICRKRCRSEILPEDIPEDVLKRWYSDKDYHAMYIGEIMAAYKG